MKGIGLLSMCKHQDLLWGINQTSLDEYFHIKYNIRGSTETLSEI